MRTARGSQRRQQGSPLQAVLHIAGGRGGKRHTGSAVGLKAGLAGEACVGLVGGASQAVGYRAGGGRDGLAGVARLVELVSGRAGVAHISSSARSAVGDAREAHVSGLEEAGQAGVTCGFGWLAGEAHGAVGRRARPAKAAVEAGGRSTLQAGRRAGSSRLSADGRTRQAGRQGARQELCSPWARHPGSGSRAGTEVHVRAGGGRAWCRSHLAHAGDWSGDEVGGDVALQAFECVCQVALVWEAAGGAGDAAWAGVSAATQRQQGSHHPDGEGLHGCGGWVQGERARWGTCASNVPGPGLGQAAAAATAVQSAV